MSARLCCYKGCNVTRKKYPGIRMYKIPISLSEVWARNTGNTDLIGLSPKQLRQNKLICENHFSSKDILPSGRLLHGTVPECYHDLSEDAPSTSETRICSDHFIDDDFELSLKQQLLGYTPKNGISLKSDAVPSINLPTNDGIKNRCLKTYKPDSRRRKQLLDDINVTNDEIVVSRLHYSQGNRNDDDEDTYMTDELQIKGTKLQNNKVASAELRPEELPTSRQADNELQPDQQIFIEENQAYKALKDEKRKREECLHEEYQRVKKSLLEASEGLETMFQNMKKVRREEEPEEDDCALYVRTVADRLRQLTPEARIKVQNRIDTLLFEEFLQESSNNVAITESIDISETNIKIECKDESYSYT